MSPARALNMASSLAGLAKWAPAGALIEACRLHVAGIEGLSDAQVDRLRRWSARWRSMDPRLRVLYAAAAPRLETVSVVLWRVMEGGPPLAPWQRGLMSRLWREAYGYPAPFDLAPYPAPIASTPPSGGEERAAQLQPTTTRTR